MKNDLLNEFLKIADIHTDRLNYALENLKPIFPFNAKTFQTPTKQQLLFFELFASRFAKLQDLLGTKIFPQVLELTQEPGEFPSFIDKLNQLERLGYITDQKTWLAIRQLRNGLSHEYPDNPEQTATNFNAAYKLVPTLLETLQKIKQFAKTN
jgi:hypothetical protein